MKIFKGIMVMLLLLLLGLPFVSCAPNNSDQEEPGANAQTDDFALVKPSQLGVRDYWELARTFDHLSVQFINAIFSKDNEKLKELTKAGVSLDIEVKERKEVMHVKQQAVVYDEGKYNSIMQFGIEDEPYRYFHIYFEDINDEWKICDVQTDA